MSAKKDKRVCLILRCTRELDYKMTQKVKLEHCRRYGEVAICYLEIMLAVVNQKRCFLLWSSSLSRSALIKAKRAVNRKISLSKSLRDGLRGVAGEYGIPVSSLVPVLLAMCLYYEEELEIPGIARKEVLIEAILALPSLPA